MTAFSNFLEEQILKHMLRTGSVTKPMTIDTDQLNFGTGVDA